MPERHRGDVPGLRCLAPCDIPFDARCPEENPATGRKVWRGSGPIALGRRAEGATEGTLPAVACSASLTSLLSAPTKENLLIIRVTIDTGWHFLGLPSARPHPAPKDVGMFYIHADPPKSLPPIPVRVSRRSQLTAALRQHARPIVIEDQKLAGPFVRLLRARQLRLWGLGEFVANTMSCGIDQSYGANVEAHWYVGRYVLPGNVQKVILKPKPYGAGRLPRHLQA